MTDHYGLGAVAAVAGGLTLIFAIFAPAKTTEVVDAIFGTGKPQTIMLQQGGKQLICHKYDGPVAGTQTSVTVKSQNYICG